MHLEAQLISLPQDGDVNLDHGGWLQLHFSAGKVLFPLCGWQVVGREVASPSGSESVTTVMLAKWRFSLIFLVVVYYKKEIIF